MVYITCLGEGRFGLVTGSNRRTLNSLQSTDLGQWDDSMTLPVHGFVTGLSRDRGRRIV